MVPSAKSVFAKYKSKKEVPKADGSGTTTIYEYGPRQEAQRHKEKADRVEKLRRSMSDLRSKARSDLSSKDDKKRLTALAVCLIDETYERVGNEESAENGHHGVTNWEVGHVTFSGNKATIKYVGKSGVKHEKVVDNAKVVAAMKAAAKGKSKGDKLLCAGDDCDVLASDVNEYLKPYDVTAKDIRGLHANEEMRRRLKEIRSTGEALPKGRKERDAILKKEFKEALEGAAEAVGHEPATLRSQYLVPGLEDAYMKDGTIIKKLNEKSAAADTVDVGLFFRLPEDIGAQFPYKEQDPSPAHVTFLFIGEVPKIRVQELVALLAKAFSRIKEPIQIALGPVDYFNSAETTVVHSTIRFSISLSEFRSLLWSVLIQHDFEVKDSYPTWNPHTTIAYASPGTHYMGPVPQGTWTATEIELWVDGEPTVIPFGV